MHQQLPINAMALCTKQLTHPGTLAAVRHHTFFSYTQYKVKDMTQADFGRLEIDLAYVGGGMCALWGFVYCVLRCSSLVSSSSYLPTQ